MQKKGTLSLINYIFGHICAQIDTAAWRRHFEIVQKELHSTFPDNFPLQYKPLGSLSCLQTWFWEKSMTMCISFYLKSVRIFSIALNWCFVRYTCKNFKIDYVINNLPFRCYFNIIDYALCFYFTNIVLLFKVLSSISTFIKFNIF